MNRFRRYMAKLVGPRPAASRPLLIERLEERILLAATPLIDKDVDSTSSTATSGTDVTIGEQITYELVVSVKEGVTNSLVVTDDLPDGIDFVAGTLNVTPDATPPNHLTTTYVDEATSASYDGDVLTVNLGTITSIFDGDPTNDKVTLTYDAVVRNVAGNQDGDAKPNTATVTDGINADTDNANVDIVEPSLSIAKTADSPAGEVFLDDPITYKILVSHRANSHSNAFEVTISDDLPEGFFGPTLVSATRWDGIQAPVDETASFSIVGNKLTTTSGVDLRLDAGFGAPEQLLVTLRGRVSKSMELFSVIENDATVTWSSLDGSVAGERDGSGGVNDYSATDAADIRVTGPIPVVIPVVDVEDEPLVEPAPLPVLREIQKPNPRMRYEITELEYKLPPLPVSPLYSGSAMPGTTLTVMLMSDQGDMLGSQSVVADAGGNWSTIFASVYLEDYPYTIEVHHEGASRIQETFDGSEPLLHFSPAMNIITVWKTTMTQDHVFVASAGRSIDLMDEMLTHPLGAFAELYDE